MYEDILSFFKTYSQQSNTNVIVFYNCSPKLQNLFSNCDFLVSYITNNKHMVIYEYNKIQFPTPESFYYNIINETYPENNEAFSYKFEDNIETYHIIHNNTFAELLIYYDDLMEGLMNNSIEFNINGLYMRIPYDVSRFGDPSFVYKFIIDYIDNCDTETVIDDNSSDDTVVDMLF
jgi:hypothetical protein